MILDSNETYYYKHEFFFHGDQNYIVYVKQSYSIPHIQFEIYRRSGELIQILKWEVEKNIYDGSYLKLLISPTGKYMLAFEEIPNPSADPYSYNKEYTAVVRELVFDNATSTFSLEKRKEILDIKTIYDKVTNSINSYNYYSSFEFYLTDSMDLLYINKTDKIVMYNEIHWEDLIKDKFGKNEYNQDLYKNISDINNKMGNCGFIFYSSEEVFILRYEPKLKTVMPLIKANFKINKGQMYIDRVYSWIDPSIIVISFSKDSKYLILVWDIVNNKEILNFSSSSYWQYVLGRKSKAGYILNGDVYVNLDKGLINYFFEYTFSGNGFYNQQCGMRINDEEDIILENGSIITKEQIIEVSSLDELVEETSNINANNIWLERVRFQVNGNTAIHFFALNYEVLNLILDYMEVNKPEYLTAILMKNNNGKSPIDITIDNESPRNTELLLRKLWLFNSSSLSNLFYDRFNELLSMNIAAFHEYLDSWFFQTIQMKGIKYLKLKNDKDPWLVTHTCWLIDEVFVEKYCKNDQKRILEIEKRRKEEDMKREEIKKKKQEERK